MVSWPYSTLTCLLSQSLSHNSLNLYHLRHTHTMQTGVVGSVEEWNGERGEEVGQRGRGTKWKSVVKLVLDARTGFGG